MRVNYIDNIDCLEGMKAIPDGSVDMVFTDPPYNVGKGDWDRIAGYEGWFLTVVKEISRVLKPNGVFYFWHNKIGVAMRIINAIEEKTDFKLKNMLVWDKPDQLSRKLAYYPSSNGLRSWFDKCEYLFYFERTHLFGDVLQKELKRLGIKQKEIAKLRPSKTGGVTGWISNIMHGDTPKRDDWDLVCSVIGEYNYDDLCVTHNTDGDHCNVIRTPSAKRPNFHVCEKPLDVCERIIRVSSNPGDVILDPFMGSATTAVACVHTGRNFIGFELNEEYHAIAQQRIAETVDELLEAEA